uniref:Uncharacterized protein n=1 Tax=virus sp. ctpeS3 TaxID=2826815 RepID=A0A8S5R9N3_9VIRU|nr:MAG TPA: hypothetical protein [virus sp. ctpeS3]
MLICQCTTAPGLIAGQLATAPTAAHLIFGTAKRDIEYP